MATPSRHEPQAITPTRNRDEHHRERFLFVAFYVTGGRTDGALMAIQTFKDGIASAVFDGKRPKGFPADLFKATRRKLAYLHAATTLNDLRAPPGNRLEALQGDRAGRHSIRINDQFRICFAWTEAGPADVEFVDYHR